jgi:hypothetical protein
MLRAVDQDLYLKLCEVGKGVGIDKVLYYYRIHPDGISTGGDNRINVSKALYWHWYAINAAAKRRGVYVEDLFSESFLSSRESERIKQEINLIHQSKSYKIGKFLSSIVNLFRSKKY